ncbi:hypothetical protein [Ferruginibacter sp.]
MKLTPFKYFATLLIAVCFTTGLRAQDDKGYKETLEMNVDDKGEMTVVSKIVYNAATWASIKQQHGTDKSVLKNLFKAQFPKYVLTDFDISDDDMERTINIKFKILGGLKLDENGKWMAELDSKNPNITKITETQFLMVDEASAQTSKINLPKSASDAKIEPDAFGKAILSFSAPVGGGMFGTIIKYLGILVAAGGAFLFFKGGKLNALFVKDPKNKKIDYKQQKHIDDAIVINTAPSVKESIRTTGNNIDTSHE